MTTSSSMDVMDIAQIKIKMHELLHSTVTISFISKQKRKSVSNQKGVLTNVSENLFCIEIPFPGYTSQLSFTFAEIKTGKVTIRELTEV